MQSTTLTTLLTTATTMDGNNDIEVTEHGSNHYCEPPMSLTQQSLLQITLNGPYLLFAIMAIMFSIHAFQPSLTCILLALSPLPFIVYNDYANFINLGPGGTPATFKGYLKITYLRLFALSDPYTPATFSDSIYPKTGYYEHTQLSLPKRHGPRPAIAGIAPQRQLNQSGCAHMYKMLRTALENLAVKHPAFCAVGTSCFEKKGLALFSKKPINVTCRGEICHVHHSDRSMHMNLHPDDAKVVLEKGWGERHPLARGGWMKAYVPREFIMVYAPRNLTELDAACHIIEAAAYWVSGERFEIQAEMDRLLQREEESANAAKE